MTPDQQAATGTMWKPDVVPYVTSYTGEHDRPAALVATKNGLRFAGEVPGDRDSRGVLWIRQDQKRGAGRPDFGGINSARQRRCMSRFLCQVCAGPPSVTTEGMLFLLLDKPEPDWEDWPERMGTVHPPLCARCAGQAIRMCSALKRGFTAVRVRRPVVAGVDGKVYGPPAGGAEFVQRIVQYDEPDVLRWTIAEQLVAILLGCTVITDLENDLRGASLLAAPTRD
ncbi:hypothetical protein [Kitasatospora sp. NPDC085464]|uniref:hypothetical protein n=1 Tax=Kitasatospora sp. NPDC085464 TaxID=3364063 RepID=UPI0037C931CE